MKRLFGCPLGRSAWRLCYVNAIFASGFRPSAKRSYRALRAGISLWIGDGMIATAKCAQLFIKAHADGTNSLQVLIIGLSREYRRGVRIDLKANNTGHDLALLISI